MKTIFYYFLGACFFGLVSSCEESDIMTYGEVNYIYFEEGPDMGELYPSRSFTFIFEDLDLEQITLQIPVSVTGQFTGEDRSFTVSAADSSTAIEGVHYIILNEANRIVDGETGGMLSIQLNRTADLEENEVTLILMVGGDAHFAPGENNTFILRFSDFFAEPDWWMYPGGGGFFPNIGPFTQVKAGYWLEFYGIEDGSNPWCCEPYWDGETFNSTFGYPALLSFTLAADDVATFKVWLAELEMVNGAPLLDENGDRILDTMEYE